MVYKNNIKEIKISTKNYKIIDNEEVIFLCSPKEITEKTIVKIIFEDYNKEAFIIKKDGQYYCYSNECPHNHIRKLELGIISNKRITCPMHGWSFDLFTGKCLNHSTSKLKKYQIIELDDKIYIKKLTETKPKWML